MSRSEVRRSVLAGVALATLLLTFSCGEPRATAPRTPLSRRQDDAEPSLVQCPTNQTASAIAIVGPLGGTVQVGATSISIPAGALTLPQVIQVTVPASNIMEIDVSALDALNVPISPFVFNSPVTVTIDYSRCNRNDIDRTPLQVWHIDPVTKQLLEQMDASDDKVSRQVTFTTSHLSGYAVAD